MSFGGGLHTPALGADGMKAARLIRTLFRRGRTNADLALASAKGPKVETVANAHGRFGYSKTNPVPVKDPKGEIDYLARLRCDCGEPFAFRRVGSFGKGPDSHFIDGYEMVCRAGRHNLVLYMDMYHSGPSDLVPEGLTRTSRKASASRDRWTTSRTVWHMVSR